MSSACICTGRLQKDQSTIVFELPCIFVFVVFANQFFFCIGSVTQKLCLLFVGFCSEIANVCTGVELHSHCPNPVLCWSQSSNQMAQNWRVKRHSCHLDVPLHLDVCGIAMSSFSNQSLKSFGCHNCVLPHLDVTLTCVVHWVGGRMLSHQACLNQMDQNSELLHIFHEKEISWWFCFAFCDTRIESVDALRFFLFVDPFCCFNISLSCSKCLRSI